MGFCSRYISIYATSPEWSNFVSRWMPVQVEQLLIRLRSNSYRINTCNNETAFIQQYVCQIPIYSCTLYAHKTDRLKRQFDWQRKFDAGKGIYLSKALTCMNNFLYKQELLFCQGDGYLWPHCCMNNLYISHRSLYAPNIQLLSNPQHAYQCGHSVISL